MLKPCLVLLLWVIAAACSSPGRRAFEQGNFERAIVEFTREIERDPADARAFYNRGAAKHHKNDLEGAIADFTQAIRLDPDFAMAYVSRGIAKRNAGDLEGAIADETRAIEIRPDAEAYYHRARAREVMGDREVAIRDYSRAIELDSRNVEHLIARGTARIFTEDLDRAIDDFERALQFDPGNPMAIHDRGVAWLSKGDFKRATADFDRAIALHPEYALAYRNRGRARACQGDPLGSLGDLSRSLQLKRDGEVHFDRGCVRFNQRAWNLALEDFKEALELLPGEQERVRLRAWLCRARMGERDAASRELKEFLTGRKAGGTGGWHATLGRYLLGEIGEPMTLLNVLGGDPKKRRERLDEAQFFIAMKRLLDGDRPGCVGYLMNIVEQGDRGNFSIYLSAVAELDVLKKD